jgi:hypothetical protein
MSENYNEYEGGSPLDLSSEGGSPLNLSSEEQHGGNMMSDIFCFGCIAYACVTMILSIIMILVIDKGNYCKNRGGKKN